MIWIQVNTQVHIIHDWVHVMCCGLAVTVIRSNDRRRGIKINVFLLLWRVLEFSTWINKSNEM